jgi:hypothetical protein
MSAESAKYDRVIAALGAAGCRAEFHRPGQLVVCLDEPVLTGRIWITWLGQWFISTWVPTIYSVPDDSDVVALCVACVTSECEGNFYWIPEPIVQQFGLRLLSEQERTQLLSASNSADDP